MGYIAKGRELTSDEVAVVNQLEPLGNALRIIRVNAAGTALEFIDPTEITTLNGLSDVAITSPVNGHILSYNGSTWVNSAPAAASSGTVTSVSIVTANGFAGTVATATTTPAITISTSITGILLGDGTAVTGLSSSGTGNVVRVTSPTIATPTITTSATVPLLIGGTGTTSTLTLRSTSGVGAAGADIIFQTGNNGATEAMRIDNAGNVGIGTTSLGSKLQIDGGLLTTVYTLGGGTAFNNGLKVTRDGTPTQYGIINYNGGALKLLSIIEGGGNKGEIYFDRHNAASGTVTTSMVIDTTGNVGIGTTGPTNLLSLGGNLARIFWMERHTTANTAGNSLTVQSGGATSAATDKAAGALLLATGLNTGNAVPALVRLQGTDISATSGTGDRTLIDRYIPNAAKVLTNNSAISVVSATIASGSTIGGVIRYTIEVTDGTDFQVETGFAIYSSYNKAGVISGTITEINSQQNLSAGTLATTWTISNASPAVVSINANSSLIPSTGYPRITFSLENFSQQAVAIT